MTEPRKRVGARELKIRLGAYLREVRAGTTLVVTDRGTPVAELRPLPPDRGGLEESLRSLVARGVLAGPMEGPHRLAPVKPMTVAGEPVSTTLLGDREDRF